MTTVSTDRNKVSPYLKATVTVTSDSVFYAIEARATKTGDAFGRGLGFDLLSDDAAASNGVLTLSQGVNTFLFDIEAAELSSDGNYRISVFTRDASGVWNDCGQLYTKDSQAVMDKNGAPVLAKRTAGTAESYKSAYSGDVINHFITEVLS